MAIYPKYSAGSANSQPSSDLPFVLPIRGRRGIARSYTLEFNFQIQEIIDPRSGILNPATMLISYPVLFPRNMKPKNAIIETKNGALLSDGACLFSDVQFHWRTLVPAKLMMEQYIKLLALFFVEGQN